MSVVAWDGKTLAADRQATSCGLRTATHKARRLANGEVIAWVGDKDYGQALALWYERGRDAAAWPEFQNDKDDWSRLIVAGESGVRTYERQPIELVDLDAIQAWGSGRDYALGAMAMGADAAEAVQVACRFDANCGMGVDIFPVLPWRKKWA